MQRKRNALPALFLAFFSTAATISTAYASESVVYAFKGGEDGGDPVGGLIEVGGKFYGMTAGGGTSGFGTIFSLTPDGVKTTLYSFKGGGRRWDTDWRTRLCKGKILWRHHIWRQWCELYWWRRLRYSIFDNTCRC